MTTERVMTAEHCEHAWEGISALFRRAWAMQHPVARPDGLWVQVEIIGAEQPGHVHKVRVQHLCLDDNDQPVYQLDLYRIDLAHPCDPVHLHFLIGAPRRRLGLAIHELCMQVRVSMISLD